MTFPSPNAQFYQLQEQQSEISAANRTPLIYAILRYRFLFNEINNQQLTDLHRTLRF